VTSKWWQLPDQTLTVIDTVSGTNSSATIMDIAEP
jgi:hypothetical protein